MNPLALSYTTFSMGKKGLSMPKYNIGIGTYYTYNSRYQNKYVLHWNRYMYVYNMHY